MLGPTGIGVLYGRSELLNAMPPFLTGGSMITTVTMERAGFLPAPQRFEAGTQRSLAGRRPRRRGELPHRDRDGPHPRLGTELGQRLVDGLASIPGVRVLGPAPGQERIGLAAFDVAGVHAHDVGQFLDSRGIAVRVGHHCAQPLHRRLGPDGQTRASTYLYNTTDDVDAFLTAVADVRSLLWSLRTFRMSLEQLYQQIILEHAKARHGSGLAAAAAGGRGGGQSHQLQPDLRRRDHGPGVRWPAGKSASCAGTAMAARSRWPRPPC